MALFKWKCNTCKFIRRHFMDKAPDFHMKTLDCIYCRTPMVRDTGGSTSVMETRDNGVMPRAVERHRDVETLRQGHADLQKVKDDGIV